MPDLCNESTIRNCKLCAEDVSTPKLSVESDPKSFREKLVNMSASGELGVSDTVQTQSTGEISVKKFLVKKPRPWQTRFLSEETQTLAPQELPYGKVFRTEESSVRKSLLYARLIRTEKFCVRKTLLYGRVRKSLLFGGALRTEEPSVPKSLPCGRLFRTEDSSVWKRLPYGVSCS